MTVHISEFWFGVGMTLLVEVIAIIVFSIWSYQKYGKET